MKVFKDESWKFVPAADTVADHFGVYFVQDRQYISRIPPLLWAAPEHFKFVPTHSWPRLVDRCAHIVTVRVMYIHVSGDALRDERWNLPVLALTLGCAQATESMPSDQCRISKGCGRQTESTKWSFRRSSRALGKGNEFVHVRLACSFWRVIEYHVLWQDSSVHASSSSLAVHGRLETRWHACFSRLRTSHPSSIPHV